MACAEFEDLLLDYDELNSEELQAANGHVAECADCRAFLETLKELDVSLTNLFAGSNVSPTFGQSVIGRLQSRPENPRPSFVPEVLDFIGWAAVFAIIGWLVVQVSPPIQVGGYFPWVAGVAFFVTGLFFGLRAHADLKN